MSPGCALGCAPGSAQVLSFTVLVALASVPCAALEVFARAPELKPNLPLPMLRVRYAALTAITTAPELKLPLQSVAALARIQAKVRGHAAQGKAMHMGCKCDRFSHCSNNNYFQFI